MDQNYNPEDPKYLEISNKTLPIWEESILGASSKDIYLHRKIEKICSAVHFVAGFFNDEEPLRIALKDRSIKLLSSSLSFIKNPDLGTLVFDTATKLIEISSFLQTAYHTGLISEMNFNILNKEIENVLMIIDEKKRNLFNISASFMEIQELPKENSKSEINPVPNENVLNEKINERSNPSRKTVSRPLNSERANKILSILKDKGELSIKDISHHIKGCSEKTLQRELVKLVSEGLIQKNGERRWSRYWL